MGNLVARQPPETLRSYASGQVRHATPAKWQILLFTIQFLEAGANAAQYSTNIKQNTFEMTQNFYLETKYEVQAN